MFFFLSFAVCEPASDAPPHYEIDGEQPAQMAES